MNKQEGNSGPQGQTQKNMSLPGFWPERPDSPEFSDINFFELAF